MTSMHSARRPATSSTHSPRRPAVGFWPTPIDVADENWRRQRLAGEEMGRRYRSNVATAGAQRDALTSTLASELRACDEELWHTRRSVQGLWASRRILIDEVKSLREKLDVSNTMVQQQAERLEMLEHKLARTAALALAPPQALTESSRSISSSSSSRSSRSSSNELPPPQPQQPPPQPPPPPPPPPLAAPRPVVHADELQAQIDSELAHTRAELMGLLSRSTGVATSLTSGLAGYRMASPQPMASNLSPLRWGMPSTLERTPQTPLSTRLFR